MLHKVEYNKFNGTVKATDGILEGIEFKQIPSWSKLPLAGHQIHTTREALVYQDFIDTTYSFRDFVKKCLRENTLKNGLGDSLVISHLSPMAYYRGMKAEHQRYDSAFNKYVRDLKGIEMVFNELHNARAKGVD